MMVRKCLPLPDALRKTRAELKTAAQRRAFNRDLIAFWQANEEYQCQLDLEADQRAFERGYVDEPGPINDFHSRQSATNRTEKP